MKNSSRIGLMLMSAFSLQQLQAQEHATDSIAQFSLQNKHTITASYAPGIPFYQIGSRLVYNSDFDQFRLRNSGSLGTISLGYEHRLTRSFSMGINAYYSQFSSTGTMKEDSTNLEQQVDYTINRFRVQARFTYLFKVADPDLDIYIGGAIGTNKRINKLFINDVESDASELPRSFTLPFSMRAYFGMRYTIYQNLGVHLEFGLGGPMASFGINYRF